jgi:hypothetical protein
VDRHILCRRGLHGHQGFFPLQYALDQITNLVIARASVYRSMPFEDAARIGVNHKDFVVTSEEQD